MIPLRFPTGSIILAEIRHLYKMRNRMNYPRQIQAEISDRGETLVKAASFQILPVLVIAGQLLVLWFSGKENLFPDNDALLNVISCCAQIIAGLYGITLAGYTFFLSRMDALMATDATLDYIVTSVKQRFKLLIWYITATVAPLCLSA